MLLKMQFGTYGHHHRGLQDDVANRFAGASSPGPRSGEGMGLKFSLDMVGGDGLEPPTLSV
jgi:hypothetical protein